MRKITGHFSLWNSCCISDNRMIRVKKKVSGANSSFFYVEVVYVYKNCFNYFVRKQ